MPAATVNQLASLLDTYVEPDGDFKKSLNQVLARMYNMGLYRDLTLQYSLPVVNGCITLPEEADSILHTMVDGYPVPVRSLWHDFKSVGLNGNTGVMWGLIDAGYGPTKISVATAAIANTLHIVPSERSSSITAISNTNGENITVTAIGADTANGTTATKSFSKSLSAGTDGATTLVFTQAVGPVESIRFDGLLNKYDIRTTAANAATTIATVGPDSGFTRYRRFRINGSTDGSTVVHVLCKRAFEPVIGDNDIVHLANVGAIKHGLLGRLAEDNADVERAEYHWSKCSLLLEEEVNSSRGAAIPRLNIDPYGTGNQSRLYSIY